MTVRNNTIFNVYPPTQETPTVKSGMNAFCGFLLRRDVAFKYCVGRGASYLYLELVKQGFEDFVDDVASFGEDAEDLSFIVNDFIGKNDTVAANSEAIII